MILRPEVPCRLMQDEDPAPNFPDDPRVAGDHNIACWGHRLEVCIHSLEKRIDNLADVVSAAQAKGLPPLLTGSRWGKVREAVQSQTLHDDDESVGSNHHARLHVASPGAAGVNKLTKGYPTDVANGTSNSMPQGDAGIFGDGHPAHEEKKNGAIEGRPLNEKKRDSRAVLERKSLSPSLEDLSASQKSSWNPLKSMRSMTSLRTPGKGWRSSSGHHLTVEEIYHAGKAKQGGQRSMMETLVMSPYFDASVSLVVVFNALMLGVQVNEEAEHGSTGRFFSYVEYTCTAIFTIELSIRIWILGLKRMCIRSERLMTAMDIVLVVVALLDLTLDVLMTSGSGFGQSAFMVRLIKVLRMGRLLRPLRTVALLGELRVIAQMIASSFRSLFWLMCILASLTYCFALVLTQGAASYFAEFSETSTLPVEYTDVKVAYGNVLKTMYSLFLAMTGGRNWGECASLIANAGVFYGALVVVYVFINLFSVLNIVTGVFVDGAIELAKRDRHMMIEKQNTNRDTNRKHLVSLLTSVDADGDGIISRDEFFSALQSGDVQDFMNALGIDPDNAAEVFLILDSDGDGCVSMMEFVQGMEKVRGEAKSVDIQMLKLHTQKIIDTVNRLQGIQSKLLARTPMPQRMRPKRYGRWDDRPSIANLAVPGL